MKSFLPRISIAVCLFTAIAFAQSDRGTITGTVMDPARALVPNASVLATNVETGARYPTATTATGNFTVTSLPAGEYSITVEAAGFRKQVLTKLQVQVAQVLRVDATLEVGSATESITIVSEAAASGPRSRSWSFRRASQERVRQAESTDSRGTRSACSWTARIRRTTTTRLPPRVSLPSR